MIKTTPSFYEDKTKTPPGGYIDYSPSLGFLPQHVSEETFKQDVKTMCSPLPGKQFPPSDGEFSKLVFEPTPLEDILSTDSYTPKEQKEIEKLHNFFEKYSNSEQYKDIMKFTKYKSDAAASLILDLLRAKKECNPHFTMDSILSDTIKGAKNSQLGAILQYGPKPKGGHYDLSFLEKADKVSRLAKELTINYEHVARTHFELEESIHPEDDMEPRTIRSMSEQPLAQEMVMESSRFFPKLIRQELQTMQHYKRVPKPKKYAMLIDVSGSMEYYHVVEYAVASGISIVRNALKGLNSVKIAMFDGGISTPQEFKTEEDAVNFLMKTPFSGGGTNISNALKEMDKWGVDECVLITDGDDSGKYTPKTKLFTVFLNPEEGASNRYLERVSFNYRSLKVGFISCNDD